MTRARIRPSDRRFWGVAAVTLVLAALCLPARTAAAPAAGTQIGNQASATYTDASGNPQTATSNVVLTTVLPVYSVDVQQDLSQTAAPASSSSFPVSVTNTGNDTDSFTLGTSQSGTFLCSSANLFADADANGVPDNGTPINNTGNLAAGATFNLVAVCQVPGTASAGQTNDLQITATSDTDATATDFVTDTTTVTGNAVIVVTKAMSANSGLAGSGPYTITLTYTNNGNATATSLVLSDPLDPDFVYVADSGRWSDAPAVVLTDADDTDLQGTAPDQIVYDFEVTGGAGSNTVTAVISRVVPGQSGTLSFQVNVAAAATPGAIPNTAQVTYDDGSGTTVGPNDTNTTIFTVDPTVGVTFTPPAPVPSATPGSTISFVNTLVNTGNGPDLFDIEVDPAGTDNYPPGTGFFLFQSDGVTPLIDSGGDPSLPDTGVVPAGGSYQVVLRVILPAGTTGVGPFTVDKVATSSTDPNVSDPATDQLDEIVAGTVDVTNNASLGGGGSGAGSGPEAAPVETQNANPGDTVSFTLFVNNTGPAPDTYDLSAVVLPAGWSVVFRNSGGTIITNTGSVPAGGSVQVTAQVIVPASALATDLGSPTPYETIHFEARSPTSGGVDVKHDAVVVNTIRDVVIAPNNTGQAFPGGSVIYTHSLTNNGNVTEASGTLTLTTAESDGTWSSQLLLDVNGNGILDAGDTPITGPGDLPDLGPGQSVGILVRVTAPPGAALGSVNTTTVTATPSGTINGVAPSAPDSATDTTTVISGNLTLVKEQAVDADCNGVPDAAYGQGLISARPNECVMYRLTATNVGTADVTQLVVNDSTPANTTQSSLAVVSPPGAGSVTEPGVGATGTVSVDVGAVGPLPPASSVTVEFGVRIDP